MRISYRQCGLWKYKSPTETYMQVSWIPQHLAVVGKVLILRDRHSDDTWSDGWKVQWISPELISADKLDIYADMSREAHERIKQ